MHRDGHRINSLRDIRVGLCNWRNTQETAHQINFRDYCLVGAPNKYRSPVCTDRQISRPPLHNFDKPNSSHGHQSRFAALLQQLLDAALAVLAQVVLVGDAHIRGAGDVADYLVGGSAAHGTDIHI